MERTFAIIKPDAVERRLVGQILSRIEAAGFAIRAMRLQHLTKKDAEGFYAVHRERPFFGALTDFMSSGPCVVMALDDAIAQGRGPKPGQVVAFCASGGGITMAASVWRWTANP